MQSLALTRAAKVMMDQLRTIGEQTQEQPSRAMCLLFIASKYPKEVALQEIEEALQINKGNVSRVTRQLHRLGSDGSPGLDLVDIDLDRATGRHKVVKLNAKGLKAVEKILESGQAAKKLH